MDTLFLELVVYTVAANASCTPHVNTAAQHLEATAPGFAYWTHWTSLDQNLRADVVAWHSLEAAEAAAQRVATDATFAPFRASIGEVKHLAHYRLTASSDRLDSLRQNLSQPEALLELALFTTHDESAVAALHPSVHQQLDRLGTCIDHHALRHARDPQGFGDLILWQSVADHQAAGKELLAQAALVPYFEAVSEMQVFQLFTRTLLQP